MAVTLSIIIVNWNGIEFLPNCLESIRRNPPTCSYEVIVVDNASNDGSARWLQSYEKTGSISAIICNENLGFGPANNLAFSMTASRLVYFLNPDTIVLPNSIDTLVSRLLAFDQIALVAPRLLNTDRTVQPSVWVFPPTPLMILLEGLGLYRLMPVSIRSRLLRGPHWTHDTEIEVDAVSGAAMMVRRNAFEDSSVFLPDIHMFGEDAELCVRVRRSGWKILFVPDAETVHLGGQSSKQRWGIDETRMKESEALVEFQLRCLSPFRAFLNFATSGLVLSTQLVRATVAGRETRLIRRLAGLQLKSALTTIMRTIKRKSNITQNEH